MLYPVRCMTCGKVIADLIALAVAPGPGAGTAERLEELGLIRACCRRHAVAYMA